MSDFPVEKLIPLCKEFSLNISDIMLSQFECYAKELTEWNEKVNLTAITEPEQVVIKHFYDCALVLKHCSLSEGAAVIDVGTGAGFPGVVLKILRPDIRLTLLDSLNKRIVFLDHLADRLGIEVMTVHSRAEQAAANLKLREQFDLATARAVARLNVLSEYCLPFVKKGGTFVSMKGPAVREEVDEAVSAISILGGAQPSVFTETLKGEEQRSFVVIKKVSQTPPKYPRISGKISKQPL